MSLYSTSIRRAMRCLAGVLFGASLVFASSPASAQAPPDGMTKESAAMVKAAFLADLDVMRGKFLGLAEAFPPDKYSWRPMEGVRSVAEVLMLIASEGYGFAPTSLGGKAALSRDEMGPLSKISDKAQVISHLTKSFAHAKQALEAIDPATLVARRRAMGQDRTTPEIVLFVAITNE